MGIIKNLSDAEKKVLIMWLIIGIVLLLLVFSITLNQIKKSEEELNYKIVTNRDRYFTVRTAINKYYNFINNQNKEAIIHILNEKYIEDNNINENNVLDKINLKQVNLAYVSKIMCSKKIKRGIVSYYVSGYNNELNSNKKLEDAYYQVILDENTFLFNITPIDEFEYRRECNE